MGRHPASIHSAVLRRIRRMQPGAILTPRDLADLGSRTAVASALSRHTRTGAIVRAGRGLYQVPSADPLLGDIKPTPDAIAKALGGRDRIRFQPAGAYAANLLGLSNQVPLKIVYLTDGTARRLRIGRQQIILRRTTPRNMATAGRVSGLVIQALRHIGRDHADDRTVAQLRRRLSPQDRAQLKRDAHLAPAWVADLLRAIAAEGTK